MQQHSMRPVKSIRGWRCIAAASRAAPERGWLHERAAAFTSQAGAVAWGFARSALYQYSASSSATSRAPARNWRMKKPKRGVRSMEPSRGGTSPLNSFRYGSVTWRGARGAGREGGGEGMVGVV